MATGVSATLRRIARRSPANTGFSELDLLNHAATHRGPGAPDLPMAQCGGGLSPGVQSSVKPH
jgi:hypothetical protein